MTCAECRAALGGYVDGELSPLDSAAVSAHLTSCVSCTAEHSELLQMMRHIQEKLPPLQAPPALRDRIKASIARADSPRDSLRQEQSGRRWRPWLAAAGIVLAGGAGYLAGTRRTDSVVPSLADAVLSAHVRSLQPGHLTDIVSSDQHTVKPWFTGKLDYAPSVLRLETDGFPLAGGRLDYLPDRPVAALVYTRRSHVINVLSYPATTTGDVAPHLESKKGFQIANWSAGGMTWWVVSDLAADELRGFCSLLRERLAAP